MFEFTIIVSLLVMIANLTTMGLIVFYLHSNKSDK